MSLEKRYEQLLSELKPSQTKLIAVSKTRSQSEIQALYDLGQRDFGENRIAELNEKEAVLPKDINWHLIGPLQSKKVKICSTNISLIQSLDRPKIIQALDIHYKSKGVVIQGLLQFNISNEEAKHGFSLEGAQSFLDEHLSGLCNIQICGVMGMAAFTDDKSIRESQFNRLKEIFNSLKEKYSFQEEFDTISMGMSGDYHQAITCGSNMVRVGSLLFGPRLISAE